MNKIWTHGDKTMKIDVFEVNETMVKFRIREKVTRERILRRGMWNIADVLMVVSKWSPIIKKSQPDIKSIPMWITIKHVPYRDVVDVVVEFKYPWLPSKCETCSKWGHLKEVCLLNRGSRVVEPENQKEERQVGATDNTVALSSEDHGDAPPQIIQVQASEKQIETLKTSVVDKSATSPKSTVKESEVNREKSCGSDT